jgi:hypothetical protein
MAGDSVFTQSSVGASCRWLIQKYLRFPGLRFHAAPTELFDLVAVITIYMSLLRELGTVHLYHLPEITGR